MRTHLKLYLSDGLGEQMKLVANEFELRSLSKVLLAMIRVFWTLHNYMLESNNKFRLY